MCCAIVPSDCTTPLHLTDAFYTLPMVKDFIIDVLLGSPHIEVSIYNTGIFLENTLRGANQDFQKYTGGQDFN